MSGSAVSSVSVPSSICAHSTDRNSSFMISFRSAGSLIPARSIKRSGSNWIMTFPISKTIFLIIPSFLVYTKLTFPLLTLNTMISRIPLVRVRMEASAAPVPTEFRTMLV